MSISYAPRFRGEEAESMQSVAHPPAWVKGADWLPGHTRGLLRIPRSRIAAFLESLAQFWAGLVRDTLEWRAAGRIRYEFLGPYGISADLWVCGIAPHSRAWKRFVRTVLRIARAPRAQVHSTAAPAHSKALCLNRSVHE